MVQNSGIEWTDHTQNFWVGCTKVSAACDFCYAEQWAKRTGHPELWDGSRRRTKTWDDAYKLDRSAKAAGKRARMFTNSLADFFDNQIDPEWRLDAWDVIRTTENLDWLILTKRPQNISKMLPEEWGAGYPNVWLGTTTENQEEYDRRRLHLLRIPAVVHFFSVEPMMGPVIRDLANERGKRTWYICGGESGTHARRPFDLQWAEDLRRSCAETNTPFFFKQDSARQAGQRGRASDALWATKQFPVGA